MNEYSIKFQQHTLAKAWTNSSGPMYDSLSSSTWVNCCASTVADGHSSVTSIWNTKSRNTNVNDAISISDQVSFTIVLLFFFVKTYMIFLFFIFFLEIHIYLLFSFFIFMVCIQVTLFTNEWKTFTHISEE